MAVTINPYYRQHTEGETYIPAVIPETTRHYTGTEKPVASAAMRAFDNAVIQVNITGDAAVDRKAIEDILREKNITLEDLLDSLQRTTGDTVKVPGGDSPLQGDGGGVSPGLIVPIVLIAVFLVCACLCLYWHSWRDKRQQNNTGSDKSVNTSFGRFTRSFNSRKGRSTDIHIRESTRSTIPLHESIQEKVHVTPLPFPDTHKFRFYWDKDNWKLYPQENLPGPQVNTTRISMLRQQLSPIDEMEAHNQRTEDSFDVTQAYNVTAQAPFSPYRLTWLTPGRNGSESEMSTISKPPRGQSLQTTNTSMSTESCSACVKYGKSISSPFYPHHNTPTTECAEQDSSQAMKIHSELTTNTNNSRFTSYPSSPRSSMSQTSSAANSLTTSNLDTGVDASLVTSYQEPACPPSSMQSDLHPSVESSELTHSTNSMGENQFQKESDLSGGMPSLPSSILYYHQRMAPSGNVVATGNIPYFSVSGMNCSMGSSLESSENNYVDNTSMLPNVGSSNTSGNPTISTLFTSINPAPVEMSNPVPTERTQNTTEDLSKLVNDLSSIRVCPNEPLSVFPNTSENLTGFDGTEGQTGMEAEDQRAQPSGISATDGNFQHSLTELFRSWSVTAELDFSSSSVEVYQRDDCLKQSMEHGIRIDDVKHGLTDFHKIPHKRRSFDVPVLTDKIYWV